MHPLPTPHEDHAESLPTHGAAPAAEANGPVLVVENDPRRAMAWTRVLAPLGRVRFARGLNDARRLAAQEPPAVVFVARVPQAAPRRSAAERSTAWLKALRQSGTLGEAPIVMTLGDDDPDAEVAALEAGAADCVHAHSAAGVVLARLRAVLARERRVDYWRSSARLDGLTGLVNRRELDRILAAAWRQAQRQRQALSVLLLDIDHFKAFNDLHGHPAGDAALKAVADVLQSTLHRPGDTVARYGGEEFAVVLPDTDAEGARHVAQALHSALAARALAHGASPVSPCLTLSLGGVSWSPEQSLGEAGPRLLVASADAALYDAKRLGRHRSAWRSAVGTEAAAHPVANARPRPVVRGNVATSVLDELVRTWRHPVSTASAQPAAAVASAARPWSAALKAVQARRWADTLPLPQAG